MRELRSLRLTLGFTLAVLVALFSMTASAQRTHQEERLTPSTISRELEKLEVSEEIRNALANPTKLVSRNEAISIIVSGLLPFQKRCDAFNFTIARTLSSRTKVLEIEVTKDSRRDSFSALTAIFSGSASGASPVPVTAATHTPGKSTIDVERYAENFLLELLSLTTEQERTALGRSFLASISNPQEATLTNEEILQHLWLVNNTCSLTTLTKRLLALVNEPDLETADNVAVDLAREEFGNVDLGALIMDEMNLAAPGWKQRLPKSQNSETAPSDVLKADSDNALNAFEDAPLTELEKTTARNSIQERLLRKSEAGCRSFLRDLTSLTVRRALQGKGLFDNLPSIGPPYLPPPRELLLQSRLSSPQKLTSSWSMDRTYAEAIDRSIRLNRHKMLAHLKKRSNESILQYGLARAIVDTVEYHDGCTILNGLKSMRSLLAERR